MFDVPAKARGTRRKELTGADHDGDLYKGIRCFMIVRLKENMPFVIKKNSWNRINGDWLTLERSFGKKARPVSLDEWWGTSFLSLRKIELFEKIIKEYIVNRLLPIYVVIRPWTSGMAARLRGGWTRTSGPSAALFGSRLDHPFPTTLLPLLSPLFFLTLARFGKPESAPFAALSLSLFSLFLLFSCFLCSASPAGQLPAVTHWDSPTPRALPAQISRR